MAENEPFPKRFKIDEIINHQSTHDEQKSPKTGKEKQMQFMELNDDCLLEIMKHSSINDLERIANTCVRLQKLARYHFSFKHKQFDIAMLLNGSQMIRCSEAQCVLNTFGSEIKTLNLNTNHLSGSISEVNSILLQISQCCSLTELMIRACNIPSFIAQQMFESFFLTLEKFELSHGAMDMVHLNSPNLKVLKLTLGKIVGKCYPMLEELRLTDCYSEPNILPALIRFAPELKVLSIVDHIGADKLLFQAIGETSKNLNYFELNEPIRLPQKEFEIAMKHLCSISSLKTLKLNCSRCILTGFLADLAENCIKIEHLHLANGFINVECVESLGKMVNVKKLELKRIDLIGSLQFDEVLIGLPVQLQELHIKMSQYFNTTAVKKLLRKAVHLKILKIESFDLFVNADTYNEMLAIIKNRPDATNNELTMVIYGDELQLDVPNEMMQKQYLEIITMDPLNLNLYDFFESDIEPGTDSEPDSDDFDLLDFETSEDEHSNDDVSEDGGDNSFIYGIEIKEADSHSDDSEIVVPNSSTDSDEDFLP